MSFRQFSRHAMVLVRQRHARQPYGGSAERKSKFRQARCARRAQMMRCVPRAISKPFVPPAAAAQHAFGFHTWQFHWLASLILRGRVEKASQALIDGARAERQ